MNLADLASKVLDFLVAYVSVGSQEFVRGVGKAAFEKAKNLLAALKTKWTEDQEAKGVLEDFEEDPQRHRLALENCLQATLSQDSDFATQLDTFVREMGPTIAILQRMGSGTRVSGLIADEITSGEVTVAQEIEQADNVTGAKIKRIGP